MLVIKLLLLATITCAQRVLIPPYFDIAKNKKITATATCGEDYSAKKDEPGELFCTLVKAPGRFGIKGLSCGHCVAGDFGDGDSKNVRDHNIRNANDGSNRWWMSPPLSRGLQYKKVNVTIDLGQSFHVAYVIIKSANSPRPGVWSLERSNDGGKTYSPWHHFAPSAVECRQYFGIDSYQPITRDDSVICSTEYSKIPPFENGEIHISLINGRPGASNFAKSKTLQEWTMATNIRFRLLDIKTLLTDLLPLSLDDPTVTRRYYYSIKDISIGGRCMCNGFAEECRPTEIVGQYKCNCQYNADGPRCGQCKEGYVQKKWRPRTADDKFECQRCNCHGHTDQCVYNEEIEQRKLSLDINGNYEGGGVCKDCQHNTHGINCEKCKPFFYRPANVPIDDPGVCQPCNCNTEYSTGLCAEETGQCECKPNFVGRYCDRCNKGYHMFPQCKPCECDVNGAEDGECIKNSQTGRCRCRKGYGGAICDKCLPGYFGFPECKECDCLTRFGAVDSNCRIEDGQCNCKYGFSGRQCEKCDAGFYQFPYCKECGCNPSLTSNAICEPGSGTCDCKPKYSGAKCQVCAPGYYSHPSCYECKCSTSGSLSPNCDTNSGRCSCKPNYDGYRCDRCAKGFYGFPNCIPCNCNSFGSITTDNCEPQSGQCSCSQRFMGRRCDQCLNGFYGFPDCQQCNCNPAGTEQSGNVQGGCSTDNDGQCYCKQHVTGLECGQCKPGFYNLNQNNPQGCSECGCSGAGTRNGVMSCSLNGQCSCKEFVEPGKCSKCKEGYYNVDKSNIFGCSECGCNKGGSVSDQCTDTNGQCRCRDNIVGNECSEVAPDHYVPTLCHIKAEMEDGKTPDGDALRFDYQTENFPDYSWKGFVAINDKQPTAVVHIDIPKSTNYQIFFKYVLNQIQSETGTVELYKDTSGNQLLATLNFPSTQKVNSFESAFALVRETENRPLYFPLNKGKWYIKLTAPNSKLLVDYVALIPQEYSSAEVLTKKVQNPCVVKSDEKFCNLYSYLKFDDFVQIEAERTSRSNQDKPPVLFNDTAVLSQLDYQTMIVLSKENARHSILFTVPNPGKYVAVVMYYHDSDTQNYLDFYIRSRVDIKRGKVWLNSCRYRFGCRQAVLSTSSSEVEIFEIKNTLSHLMTLYSRRGATVAIDSVALVPYDKWHLDYTTPNFYCTTKDGFCADLEYGTPPNSQKIQMLPNANDPKPPGKDANNFEAKYLKTGVNAIDLDGVKAGRYHVVVHYYQPENPTFEGRSGVYSGSGGGLPGRFTFKFCANLNGCRDVIRRSSSNDVYVFEEGTARLRFDIPTGAGAWIEHILLIPAEDDKPLVDNTLAQKDLDYSKDFLKQCFSLEKPCENNNQSEFCKDGIFTLTTDFNAGALECECSQEGSLNSKCEKFGGQCPCKDNVIGRKCSRCKIGYYGFPDCKPCNCSNCDEITGVCTCPPGVTGDKCDECLPGTFGYDPIIGCQPCNCDSVGTGVSNAVCNVTNGQCPCKENFGSRKCSACSPGFYNYPICQKCDCLSSGVTDAFCDAQLGKCFCQDDVIGAQCNECPVGYFKTQNPNGKQLCTKCWCQGRSTQCTEAQLYKAPVTFAKEGWTLSIKDRIALQGEGKVTADLTGLVANRDSADIKNIVYWVAPKQLNGDLGASYGGQLTYTFTYDTTVAETAEQSLDEMPDVIIKGDGMALKSSKQVFRLPTVDNTVELTMTEADWIQEDGALVDREIFLRVLSNVEALHIRASHDVNTKLTSLSDVSLDSSLKSGGEVVFGLEECFCPTEYDGPSCSKCANGYTRQADGTCGKCDCLGRSDICDPESGVCRNCSANTEGDKCELCKPGFYGDDCKPCACPSTDPSRNFADSCYIDRDADELVCQCKEGYVGNRCEKCADGYSEDKTSVPGACKKCECSGNIDSSLKGNCDASTGECFKCLNNTSGFNCDQCKDGFYGDAVDEKNCQDCECSVCGTTSTPCDNKSGKCHCKNNVVGDKCDRCAKNTWNFNSCLGCQPCNCGAASTSEQCDLETGRCDCLPNVIGKNCNYCALGYYGYEKTGCKKCDCPDGKPCDINTGKCDCGLLGELCTLCPPGYIIENGKCVECDNCVQNVLNKITILTQNITNIEKNIVPSGAISDASLDEVNKTLTELQDKADMMLADMKTMKKAVGYEHYGKYDGDMGMSYVKEFERCHFHDNETTTTAQPITTTTEFQFTSPDENLLKHEVCSASLAKVMEKTDAHFNESYDKVADLEKAAYDSSRNATDIKDRAQELLDKLQKFKTDLDSILSSANNTLGGLNGGNIDANSSLNEAEKILEELEKRNLTGIVINSDREKRAAQNASRMADGLMEKAMNLQQKASKFTTSILDLLNTLRNIKQTSRDASGTAMKSHDLVEMAKNMTYQPLIDEAVKIDKENNKTAMEAMDKLTMAKNLLQEAKDAYKSFNNQTEPLEEEMEKLRNMTKNLAADLAMATGPVNDSINHARKLKELADELKQLLQDTNKFAEAALRAARVYKTIVEAIYEALEAAKMAKETAEKADKMSNEAKKNSAQTKVKSDTVESEARDLKEDVDKKLKVSLEGLDLRVGELKELRKKIQGRINLVKDDLKTLGDIKGIGKTADEQTVKANNVTDVANEGKMAANKTEAELVENNKDADKLSKDIGDINKAIREAADNVTEIEKKIPDLENATAEVRKLHDKVEEFLKNNVSNGIDYLKYLIQNAHSIIDTIPLAMNFNDSSELILDAPLSAHDPSLFNDISMLVRVQGDGPILFIGNARDNNSAFMSIDVVDSRVVFKYRLNTGPVYIIENPQIIDIGKNYRVHVMRKYASASLMLSENKISNNEVIEVPLQNATYNDINNDSPILSLGPDADVFVGFMKTSGNRKSLNGCLSELMVDDERMGLWDWKEAKHVTACQQPVRSIQASDYIFSGDGFAEFDIGSVTYGLKKIELSFATLEPNGLIFLATDPPQVINGVTVQDPIKNFYSLEIKDGQLVSKFDFGNGYNEVPHTTAGLINDGQKHKFEMKSKSKKFVRFWLDDSPERLNDIDISSDENESKSAISELYIGGVPMRAYLPSKNLTTDGFIGSIGNVLVRGLSVLKTVSSFNNVKPGFQLPFGHSASFPSESSRIEIEKCKITLASTIGFTFQTEQTDGVILKGTSSSVSITFKVESSQVSVTVAFLGTEVTLTSKVPEGVSDGHWHTVSLHFDKDPTSSENTLYLGTDKSYVKEVMSIDIDQLELSLALGSEADANNGFNGNIRQVYCSLKEINLAAMLDTSEDTLVGTLPLKAPKDLSEVTFTPTTLAPTTTTTTTTPTPTTTTSTTTTTTTTPVPTTTTTTAIETTTTTPVPTTTTTSTPTTTTTTPTTTSPSTTTTDTPTTTTEVPTTTTTLETTTTSTDGVTTTTEAETTTTEESTTTTTEITTTTTEEPTTTTTTTTTTPTTTPTTTSPTTTTTTTTTSTTTTTTESPTTTTTTPTTTTTTAKPEVKCESRLKERKDGFGLGMNSPSYLEFSVQPNSLSQKSLYEFYFYTLESEGVLLLANKGTSFDYEIIFLNGGKITYMFNAGSGALTLVTTKTYNDGKWHLVKTQRSKIDGYLYIDNQLITTGQSKAGASSVNSLSLLYVGGFPTGALFPGLVPASNRVPLKGGIRGVKSFDKALLPSNQVGVTKAYEEGLTILEGVSFGENGGYVSKDASPVGRNFKIAIDVQSANKSGYLFYVNGVADLLSINIETDGTVTAQCNNGGGKFSVSVEPLTSICDGYFHSILLEKKSKTLTMTIDGVSNTFTTERSSTSADTTGPFYFGGIPEDVKRPSDYSTFRGCITTVRVNDKPVDLTSSDVVFGGSSMRGCPDV